LDENAGSLRGFYPFVAARLYSRNRRLAAFLLAALQLAGEETAS
jgi:hypothetical protein